MRSLADACRIGPGKAQRTTMRTFPLMLLLAACGGKELPEGVLPRQRFVDVLAEAQLIEARVNREGAIEHRSAERIEGYYDALFSQEEISREDFSRSFDHYASDPALLKEIYGEVIAELSRRKDSVINLAADTVSAKARP